MMMCLVYWKTWFDAKRERLTEEERGAVDIVAIVVLIGIAVVLAIFFKDKISQLLKDILDPINPDDIMKPIE